MDTYIIIVIIFGIIAFLLIALLFFINRLTIMKNRIEDSFIPIKSYIEERNHLLDEITAFISKNLSHEEELTKNISNSKKILENIKNASDGMIILKSTEEVINKFNHLEETYPKLKKDEYYNSLKEQLSNNQDRINYASDSYDKGVKDYNDYKEKVIVSTLSKILQFPNYNYYKNKS